MTAVFTLYCISVTANRVGGWFSVEVIASCLFYLALFGMSAWAWYVVLRDA